MIKWLIIFMLICSPCWGGIYLPNADDDYINLPDNATTREATTFTVSLWIKLDTTINDASNTDMFIIDYGDTGASGNWIIFWYSGDGGTLRLPGVYGASVKTTTDEWTGGVWYHIAFTFTSSTDADAWVNGIKENNGIPGNTVEGASYNFKIGADASANDASFQGKISEFAYWNVVLTDSEIELLVKSKIKRIPLQIQPSALIMYLPLDDFADGTALNTDADGYKDLSGNGNHGQGVDGDGDSLNVAEKLLSYP